MRKCYFAGIAALATLLGAHSSTNAENDTPHLGQMMWSAFKCATYAELAGDQGEQVRLFALGYNAGIKLLEKMDQEGGANPNSQESQRLSHFDYMGRASTLLSVEYSREPQEVLLMK